MATVIDTAEAIKSSGAARPDSADPADTLAAARAYVAAGQSVLPVKRDGSKVPARKWAVYQERLATDRELVEWFGPPDPYGIAIVGGAVSGGLELLDFDQRAAEIYPAWCELVEASCPGL